MSWDVFYLGWPIAPSYISPNAGGGLRCLVSANEYSCAHGAQINFGDLTPYLTYAPFAADVHPDIKGFVFCCVKTHKRIWGTFIERSYFCFYVFFILWLQHTEWVKVGISPRFLATKFPLCNACSRLPSANANFRTQFVFHSFIKILSLVRSHLRSFKRLDAFLQLIFLNRKSFRTL
jgi:hypothetical protein